MPIIDHYTAVEDAALVLIKESIDNKEKYFSKKDVQVSRSDDDVLSKGYDYFVILFPGDFSSEKGGSGVKFVTWHIDVEIYVRFSTTGETWKKFKLFRSDMFNLFNVKTIGRTLNRTPGVVDDVILTGGSKPVAYGEEESEADPIFFSQTLDLAIPYKVNMV